MKDQIEADFGIRQLHARYVDAVWRMDFDAFGECFAMDGEWLIAGRHMHGRDAVRQACRDFLAPYARVQLMPTLPILEVGDGEARGRLNMVELVKAQDGGAAMSIGVYHDRYVEEDGRWRFARRHWVMHYRGPVDLSAALLPAVDCGPFPAAPDE